MRIQIKRYVFQGISICLALILLAFPIFAGEAVSVEINGRYLYYKEPMLIHDTTYVGLCAFRNFLGDNGNTAISAREHTLSASGRYIYSDSLCIEEGNEIYVPLRSLAALYRGTVAWDAETNTASVTIGEIRIPTADEVYEKEDLYWMSRIISAESRGESLYGKLGVGSVIMNRVVSPDFPSTIKAVIFDQAYGPQFTPTVNGTVYDAPTEESVTAAKMILEGYRVSRSVLYFIYEAIATNKWTVNNRFYEFTIGCHDFYS